VIDPDLSVDAWTGTDPLSERERRLLRLTGDGRNSASIASELHLTEGTVRNYLSEAIGKVGGTNRIDAARKARERGWRRCFTYRNVGFVTIDVLKKPSTLFCKTYIGNRSRARLRRNRASRSLSGPIR